MMPLHVLIVDDEEDMCWALQTILAAEGCEGVVARSAHEALEKTARETFHVALVDEKLPDMEGLDLVTKIRRFRPRLPCVLVSGFFYADDERVRDGLASGLIQGFIGKPFLLSQVQNAVRAAVRMVPIGNSRPHGEFPPYRKDATRIGQQK